MFDREAFDQDKSVIIEHLGANQNLQNLALDFVNRSNKVRYAYVWNWFGLPIIQMPEDIVKVQEIIFDSKPDVIIETGIAWGGSLLLYASVLKALGNGRVIGIDLKLPDSNRKAIFESPFSEVINLIEGSSTDVSVMSRVKETLTDGQNVMLILDSHHTHQHVLDELNLWSHLIKSGGYIVVCDTIVEYIDSPEDRIRDWGNGNNPMTAVNEFLKTNSRFVIDSKYNNKALVSFHPQGVLRAIS
jgi:cephalosporin hydroxylase